MKVLYSKVLWARVEYKPVTNLRIPTEEDFKRVAERQEKVLDKIRKSRSSLKRKLDKLSVHPVKQTDTVDTVCTSAVKRKRV